MRNRIAVLGGGAIGLSLAFELARRGNTVTLVERDRLAEASAKQDPLVRRSASSWAASGILPPANLQRATDPIDRLRGLSHQLFPDWVAALKAESGVDSQLERCGGWYLADTLGEAAAMSGMVSYWKELDIDCRPVEMEELAEREPALSVWAGSTPAARAWWVEDEYQIHTPSYLDALAESCRRLGVAVLDRHQVEDLDEHSGRVEVRVQSRQGAGRVLEADRAVVCGGVWSGRFAERMRLSQSLIPVRGQILLLKTPSRSLHSIVNCGHRYVVPRRDGFVLVGSSEEEVGIRHGTSPAILADLRRFVANLCPGLATAREVAAWSGLRPMTFDGFPMCGKLPAAESIYVATGHYRSGIHLSPGTAICLADVMSGQTPPVSLDAFSVGKQQHHGA